MESNTIYIYKLLEKDLLGIFFVLLSFGNTKDETQGLVYAMQALYY